VLFIREADDGCNRTEDLLLRHSHVVFDVGKYRGFDEIAALAEARAARDGTIGYGLAEAL
jgi:hypothetical protein